MQWQYGASNKHIGAMLELLKGELGEIVRAGGELPKQVTAADGLMKKQVCSTCVWSIRHAFYPSIIITGGSARCEVAWLCRMQQLHLG